MSEHFLHRLRATLSRQAASPGLVFGDQSFSYGELESRAEKSAALLQKMGVRPGDRVALYTASKLPFLMAHLGALFAGAVSVPLNPRFTREEMRYFLTDSEARVAVVGAEQQALVEALQPELPALQAVMPDAALWNAPPGRFQEHVVTAEDSCLMIYSSGTTGWPKGVVHTHGAAVRHGFNLARFDGLSNDTRIFCGMPFFWVGGVGFMLSTALAVGNTLLCLERWQPDEAIDLMEREAATACAMQPYHRQRLGAHIDAVGRDVSKIPALSALPVDRTLRHTQLGMTETWGPYSSAGPEAGRILPEELRGSFGLIAPHVQFRLVDMDTHEVIPADEQDRIGEVQVRGYMLMAGLLKKERHETFDDDGWYHTGDRGWLHDGYLFFGGRLTQMIKTAGANVSPLEVERAIEESGGVVVAAVVGLPDEERGQTVAAVVAAPAGTTVDVQALERRVRERISSYKVPRRWLVVDEGDVPHLATGKADLRALRSLLLAGGTPVGPGR